MVFVVPKIPPKPRTYQTSNCGGLELVGVTYRVRTIISFKGKYVIKPPECVPYTDTQSDNVIPQSIFIFRDTEYKPDEQYGFEVKVYLTSEEYYKNKRNIEEYVCKQARSQYDYQAVLNDCIEKHADGRDYTVEAFIPFNDPGAIDMQFGHNTR